EWRDASGAVVAPTAAAPLNRGLGSYTFTPTVKDGGGGTSTAPTTALEGGTAPPPIAVTPPPHVTPTARFPLVVEGTAADLSGVLGFDVAYSADGGAAFTPVAGCANLPPDARSCTWSDPGPAAGPATLRVVARDGVGNTGFGDTTFVLARPTI